MNIVDIEYIAAVDRWMSVLFQYIQPYLYANGGPIIMVQVANDLFYLCTVLISFLSTWINFIQLLGNFGVTVINCCYCKAYKMLFIL